MVSRRKILSRSRDDLNLDISFNNNFEEEEDVWHQKEKLFKDHIQEVLNKWQQIDDEIWAKVIVLERNRRVAKAYARAPVLTVNGSEDGFDGFRIGLNGFDNPMRDQKTEDFKRLIGHGVKIKMDDFGNILIKRISRSQVYIKSTTDDENNAIGMDITKLPNYSIELEKAHKLFDMKKFQMNLNRELKRAYPDRRRLENQCLSAIAFVKNEQNILDCPIWLLIINVVAMDMLKSKFPPLQYEINRDIRNRPRIPAPDEIEPYDPYSINKSRNREKPPQLPPRVYPKPDYDDIDNESQRSAFPVRRREKKTSKVNDDPYYCGLRARVPNFVKTKENSKRNSNSQNGTYQSSSFLPNSSAPPSSLPYNNGLRSFRSGTSLNQITSGMISMNSWNLRNGYTDNFEELSGFGRRRSQVQPGIFIGEWDS